MSGRPYITCRQLIEDFLAEYLDGALTEIQAEDFQRHLAVCSSCRAYLATFEKMLRAARAVREEPGDAPEELIRAILEIRRR